MSGFGDFMIEEATKRGEEIRKLESRVDTQRAEIERLTRECESLRKDAARYLWLQDQSGYVLHSNPAQNDADIDAALATSNPPGKEGERK